VEAPGVEGRGEHSGCNVLRDASSAGAQKKELMDEARTGPVDVLRGLEHVRCSDVVAVVPELGHSARPANDLEARLNALEAALVLTEALIASRQVESALAVLRAVRRDPLRSPE
jgi:hypothetical protein